MNRLAGETSPYLLQHADNPVDWYPWGDEAFARARAEDKPILLSIGYSACHWCHVMAHESFEDPATAALMNEHFVNIKVDREERPDVDAIYMEAVVAMTGSGGWPMTVFLTPEGEPFYGGTYFPPEPRHGMPSFRQVLARGGRGVARAARRRRARRRSALVDARAASRRASRRRREPLTAALLGEAERAIARRFDPALRRFGPRAEVPAGVDARVPPAPRRRSSAGDGRRRRSTGWRAAACTTWSAAAFTATRSTSAGSCRTSRRCCTTTRCSLPRTCTRWLVTGNERYREIVEETLEYVLRELRSPEGGLRIRAGRRHGRRRGADVHVDAGGGRPGTSCSQPFEHGRLIMRGELTPELKAELFERSGAAAEAGPRRQGDRCVERSRARRTRRGRRAARERRLA